MARISKEQYKINLDITFYFIKDYIKKNGYAPTYREIAEGTNKTLDTIFNHLRKLREENKIDFVDTRSRTIRIK